MPEPNKWDFFTVIDRVSSVAIINLLWVAISVFIITLPAATAGLFGVCGDWVQGKDSETFDRFFSAMRRHAGRATLLVLVDGLVLGLVGFNVVILPATDLPTPLLWPFMAITLAVGMLAVIVNLYLWPLLVNYDIPLPDLTRIALSLSFRHAGWSLVLLIMSALYVSSGVILLPLLLIILVFFAGCAWLISWGSWRIIQRYDVELQQLENEGA